MPSSTIADFEGAGGEGRVVLEGKKGHFMMRILLRDYDKVKREVPGTQILTMGSFWQ